MIPENELHFDFVRSSGPGGQNVNKTSTKAQLRWKVGESAIFSVEEKERIRTILHNRLNKEDEIVIESDEERSQAQNREEAVNKLNTLVSAALFVPKKRRATRPTRASKERRLDEKKIHSRIKKNRQSAPGLVQ